MIKQGAEIEFFYDHTGVAGFYWSGLRFLYRKDAQGNVIALLFNGRIMARYLYDAWGNVTVVDNSGEVINDATHVGHLNPFRYRSYYYDTETKLYFLNTRYYDPETGRFMTIDGIEYLDPETINGLNLYAYCGNNPVMNIDPNGNAWWNPFSWDWESIGKIALGITIVAGLAVASMFTGGAASLIFAGAAISGGLGFLAGGISGILLGGGLAGFADGALSGAITGAISGAIAVSPLNVYGQIAANALLNMGQYIVIQSINNEKLDPYEMLFQGVLGAFAGAIGGHGAMYIGRERFAVIMNRQLVKYGIGFIPKVGVPIFKGSAVNLGGILFGKILGLN